MYVVWTGNNEGCVGGGAIEVREGGGGGRVFGRDNSCRVGVRGGEAVVGVDGGENREEVGVPGREELV